MAYHYDPETRYENDRFPRANGELNLDLGWRGAFYKIRVVGGPFAMGFVEGRGHWGICLVERDNEKAKQHLPIADFSIPQHPDSVVTQHLVHAIDAALEGHHVYIGCAGGWGRTGLFLSLLAKACGQPDPVEYVREHYTPRAVETVKQYDYVEDFDMQELQQRIQSGLWRSRVVQLIARLKYAILPWTAHQA